jgi:hypothetical protein
MALGMKVIIETRDYVVTKYRHGTELTDRLTGKEIYFQPGEDELSFLSELEAIEESEAIADKNAAYDILLSQYV